jgi:hypothetical protein
VQAPAVRRQLAVVPGAVLAAISSLKNHFSFALCSAFSRSYFARKSSKFSASVMKEVAEDSTITEGQALAVSTVALESNCELANVRNNCLFARGHDFHYFF